jgi:hypothetical protein
MFERLELERLLERLDRLCRVLVAVVPEVSDLVEDLEALFTVDDVVEDLPLVRDDLLPVLELRVERDERLERGRWAESTPSAFSKLLMACFAWPCSRLMRAELVVDVRRGRRSRPSSSDVSTFWKLASAGPSPLGESRPRPGRGSWFDRSSRADWPRCRP